MPTYKSLTLLLTIGLMTVGNATADVSKVDQKQNAMANIKIATITKMYQQDIDDQGMSNPVVLQQYADTDLKAAMQLEQAYFDKNQMSCNIDYDVLWNSQDPNYTQDKKFSITEQGLVQVSLAQGSDIYYELSCDDSDNAACQVADVILDKDGKTLRKHLLKACR
ncbi:MULTISPECIES: hypothetical protein [unclassified Psychrobacter]|uniref:hypothetical protein n=1 Tax=unclassified Psychrobacter TaxID=196806 RepID=UPI0025B5378A|nr:MULTISPECIES: hypothetical protein [unclassified Psychrobacter]MDN3453132.1 hypothetical protein [Psychrobacter sp. APC 3350]MDN3501931.1 hypothetical protein [Psychrobacter sp. 5A.1]